MFKVYRPIERGEFFLVAGDCSQGGADSNFAQFMSKTKLDIPIVYIKQGAAESMTEDIFPALEYLYDFTGIKPVVAFERQNGGISEMERLRKLNRNNKYVVYLKKDTGTTEGTEDSDKLGWDTNTATRPTMLGSLKEAIKSKLFRSYDEESNNEFKTFIVGKDGKPQAARGKHDDGVMSRAIVWQMYQTEEPFIENTYVSTYTPKKWGIR